MGWKKNNRKKIKNSIKKAEQDGRIVEEFTYRIVEQIGVTPGTNIGMSHENSFVAKGGYQPILCRPFVALAPDRVEGQTRNVRFKKNA